MSLTQLAQDLQQLNRFAVPIETIIANDVIEIIAGRSGGNFSWRAEHVHTDGTIILDESSVIFESRRIIVRGGTYGIVVSQTAEYDETTLVGWRPSAKIELVRVFVRPTCNPDDVLAVARRCLNR